MQIIIDLTPEQEAALNYIASKLSIPEHTEPGGKVIPTVVVDPAVYLRARFDQVLASYVEQMNGDDAQAIVEAFKSAANADKDAVFSALKIERPTTAATAEVTQP